MDAFMLLSSVAPSTERIKLGTCVTPLPFRPPAQLAKIVSTLDYISNGRVILGVGAGWARAEFDAYSQWGDPAERVARSKEALEIMFALWHDEKVTYRGKYYSITDAILDPKPVQKPNPPLWFGTTGRVMFRLAAKYGNGWIPGTSAGPSVADYRAGKEKLASEVLRVRSSSEFTWALHDVMPEEDSTSFIKKIENYASAGCEYYLAVWGHPKHPSRDYSKNELIERVKWFSRNVLPSFK